MTRSAKGLCHGDFLALTTGAQTRRDYANLCRLLSTGRLRLPKGKSRVEWNELRGHSEDLVAVSPFGRSVLAGAEFRPTVRDLRGAFGDRFHLLVARRTAAHELVDITLHHPFLAYEGSGIHLASAAAALRGANGSDPPCCWFRCWVDWISSPGGFWYHSWLMVHCHRTRHFVFGA